MGNTMNISSLFIASSLIIISLVFSRYQKLNLEKDTLIGVVRAIVQLSIIGYILNFIFGLKSPIFTSILLLFMALNAAQNSANRAEGIKQAALISFCAISSGTIITMLVLILSKAIKYEPYEIIPVGGMIISNAMVAIGLCYRQLTSNFKNRRAEIETKLALGADILPSSIDIIRDSIKTGMLPTIDSMKTLGIVSLPGTMTGLILAGTSPLQAIRFQIMVTFMLLSTTSIAAFVACYLSYKCFFNERKQLI